MWASFENDRRTRSIYLKLAFSVLALIKALNIRRMLCIKSINMLREESDVPVDI